MGKQSREDDACYDVMTFNALVYTRETNELK